VAREYPALDCRIYVTILRAHATPSLICMRISGSPRSKTFAKCCRRPSRRSAELWVRSTKRPETICNRGVRACAESPDSEVVTRSNFVHAARGGAEGGAFILLVNRSRISSGPLDSDTTMSTSRGTVAFLAGSLIKIIQPSGQNLRKRLVKSSAFWTDER